MRHWSPDDVINIQFTSGTTGTPKGATLTHHNILNNANLVRRDHGVRTGRTGCASRCPCITASAWCWATWPASPAARPWCCQAPAFDAGAVLETVSEERCTALHGVPTMFIAELDHPDFDRFDLDSLRTGIMAGAPCPVEVMKQCISRDAHVRSTDRLRPDRDQPGQSHDAGRRPAGKAGGRPWAAPARTWRSRSSTRKGASCRSVNGVISATRGYAVMKGYWDDEERTAETVDADGWLHSGDLGVMDAEGYVQVVGRIKDMIIRGGENIYPREIEEFLFTHPKIQDAKVIGVPDEKYGEEVCAWVQLKERQTLSEDEIRAFCKDHIAYFKVPRYIRIVGRRSR